MSRRADTSATRAVLEEGNAIILVMMMTLVFLGMGVALYWLVSSARNGTELERKEARAFNVAEAGTDAGMLALKDSWPVQSGQSVTVDATVGPNSVRSKFPEDQFRDPTSAGSSFIDVRIYDDQKAADGSYPGWDANKNGIMVVDSRANVDNDRHRIMILAQKHIMKLTFPEGLAMYAGSAGSIEGSGIGNKLRVSIDTTLEHGMTPPLTGEAHWGTSENAGVDLQGGITGGEGDTTPFSQIASDQLLAELARTAELNGTYFSDTTSPNNVAAGATYLHELEASGTNYLHEVGALDTLVYIKSSTAITLTSEPGHTQFGTAKQPIILILDTPPSTINQLDWKGTVDFFGLIVIKGNAEFHGAASIWGAMYSSGDFLSNGAGSSPEINYNRDVVNSINHQYMLSVSIVPNSWQEYNVANDAIGYQ